MNRTLVFAAGFAILLAAMASAQTVWVYPGEYSGSSTTYFYDSYYDYYSYYYSPGIYFGYFGVPWGFCGDYVCNYWESHHSCPFDCVVSSSTSLYYPYYHSTGESVRHCADGTAVGVCSYNQPYFCSENRTLVPKAAMCGCPTGTARRGDECVAVCSDGTLDGECSVKQPFYCEAGGLVQKASECGCPEGTAPRGERCVGIQSTCSASVNPNPVNALSSTTITVRFYELANAPSEALVDCGNGQVAVAACDSTEESPYSGTCTGQCSYNEQTSYPQVSLVKASIASLSCSSVNVNIFPPIPTTGSLLVKATSESGEKLSGAMADVYFGDGLLLEEVYFDSNGELALTRLAPGEYTVVVYAEGFDETAVSGSVEAGKTRMVSAKAGKDFCDVKAELVKAPSAFSAAIPEPAQVRLTNRANASKTVSLSMSGSLVPLDFAPQYSLAAGEQRIIALTPKPDYNTMGASTAMVAFADGNCTQYLEIPLYVTGGLTLEARDSAQTAFAGSKACYSLLVRNRGSGEGTVTLTAQSPYEVSFDASSFFLGAKEDRLLEACVNVPAGANAGNYSISFRAASAQLNDATLRSSLVVPGAAFQLSSQCVEASRVNGVVVAPVDLRNNALGGDYQLEAEAAAATAGVSLQQPLLYNFQKGTNRTIYVRVDPFVGQGGEHRFNLALKTIEGLVVQQLPLCVRIQGVRGATAKLPLTQLGLKAGDGRLLLYEVRNEGNTVEQFLVSGNTSFQSVSITPASFSLAPGASKSIEVFLNPALDTPAGLHKVVLGVYAGQLTSANLLRTDTVEVIVRAAPAVAGAALAIDVASPQFTFSQDANGSYASAVFTVVSKESAAISVIPSIEGLPAGWSYKFEPANAILTPGQSANFTANLTIGSYESGKDYTGTLVLASGPAESRTPFVVPLATASPFTGFFTLGSVENAAILVLLAMAAFAGFYYYKARELEQEESAPATESAPTPEAAPL